MHEDEPSIGRKAGLVARVRQGGSLARCVDWSVDWSRSIRPLRRLGEALEGLTPEELCSKLGLADLKEGREDLGGADRPP